MKAKGVDSEEECYEYDSDTRTLKNEQGAVYYRQVAEWVIRQYVWKWNEKK